MAGGWAPASDWAVSVLNPGRDPLAMKRPRRTPRIAPMVSDTTASSIPRLAVVLAERPNRPDTHTRAHTMAASMSVPAMGRKIPVPVAKAMT